MFVVVVVVSFEPVFNKRDRKGTIQVCHDVVSLASVWCSPILSSLHQQNRRPFDTLLASDNLDELSMSRVGAAVQSRQQHAGSGQ